MRLFCSKLVAVNATSRWLRLGYSDLIHWSSRRLSLPQQRWYTDVDADKQKGDVVDVDACRFEALTRVTHVTQLAVRRRINDLFTEEEYAEIYAKTRALTEAINARNQSLYSVAKWRAGDRKRYYKQRRTTDPKLKLEIDRLLEFDLDTQLHMKTTQEAISRLVNLTPSTVVETEKTQKSADEPKLLEWDSSRIFMPRVKSSRTIPPIPENLSTESITEYMKKLVRVEYFNAAQTRYNILANNIVSSIFDVNSPTYAYLNTEIYNLGIMFATQNLNLRLARQLYSDLLLSSWKPNTDTFNFFLAGSYRYSHPVVRTYDRLAIMVSNMKDMEICDVFANRVSWHVVIKAISSLPLKLEAIRSMREVGYDIDSTCLQSFFLDAVKYCDAEYLAEVMVEEFGDLASPAMVNVLINALLEANKLEAAWALLRTMVTRYSLRPNTATLNVLLKYISGSGRLDWMFSVWFPLVKNFTALPDSESYHHMMRCVVNSSFSVNMATVLKMLYGHMHATGHVLLPQTSQLLLLPKAWCQTLNREQDNLPDLYGAGKPIERNLWPGTFSASLISALEMGMYTTEPYSLEFVNCYGERERTLYRACSDTFGWNDSVVRSYADPALLPQRILARALGVTVFGSKDDSFYFDISGKRRFTPSEIELVDGSSELSDEHRRLYNRLLDKAKESYGVSLKEVWQSLKTIDFTHKPSRVKPVTAESIRVKPIQPRP
ncbi:hypothetical protein V1512DRAFT_259512 [Lipomyces arxii]|uniref:uncharacterized protein n=1 Tax=Lipomyces arxii TaxID=56418 RepID=UPI0034CFDDA3